MGVKENKIVRKNKRKDEKNNRKNDEREGIKEEK